MRFTIELHGTSDERVEGVVTPDGAAPTAFSGWLELLRHLETALPHTAAGAHTGPSARDLPPAVDETRTDQSKGARHGA